MIYVMCLDYFLGITDDLVPSTESVDDILVENIGKDDRESL